MTNLKNMIKYSLNNEVGGANAQTIFIIGASCAVLVVAYGIRTRVYNWIKMVEKRESLTLTKTE